MKFCECGGDLLRHAVTRYTRRHVGMIGVRYKCRECGKTFTQRMESDKRSGELFFNATGRPHRKDWRMSA
jgi:transposase-like protein